MLAGTDHAPESLWIALIDRLSGGWSGHAELMLAVNVVIDGSVWCAGPGGVRVLASAASHGLWLVEEFIAIGISVCAPSVKKMMLQQISEARSKQTFNQIERRDDGILKASSSNAG